MFQRQPLSFTNIIPHALENENDPFSCFFLTTMVGTLCDTCNRPFLLLFSNNLTTTYLEDFFEFLSQKKSTLPSGNAGFYTLYNDLSRKKIICFSQKIIHYEAKLCILCIVSGFRDKDAPFVLLLFFHFLRSFRQNFNMFKDLSMESRNKQTQNCAPIQCAVWPRNVSGLLYLLSKFVKDVEYKT